MSLLKKYTTFAIVGLISITGCCGSFFSIAEAHEIDHSHSHEVVEIEQSQEKVSCCDNSIPSCDTHSQDKYTWRLPNSQADSKNDVFLDTNPHNSYLSHSSNHTNLNLDSATPFLDKYSPPLRKNRISFTQLPRSHLS